MRVFAWCVSRCIHLFTRQFIHRSQCAAKPSFYFLLHEPKQLSPTLHKLAAAHAPLTHNCQSTDAAGSEEEGGEGERSNEGRGGGGGKKTNSERRMVKNTRVKWEKEQK